MGLGQLGSATASTGERLALNRMNDQCVGDQKLFRMFDVMNLTRERHGHPFVPTGVTTVVVKWKELLALPTPPSP